MKKLIIKTNSGESSLDSMSPAEIAAIQEVSVGKSAFTYKADIWRRCTDEEFALLKAALDAAPPRQRQIFADATRLDHDDQDFADLKIGVVGVVGKERAEELLAASE